MDDYVFYRPTQSEHVMLQFGDLITVSGGELGCFKPTDELVGHRQYFWADCGKDKGYLIWVGVFGDKLSQQLIRCSLIRTGK